MMKAKAILDYLATVANNSVLINVSMHILVLLVIAALFLSKNERLKRISFYAVISVLFLSVMLNAISFGNLFNAITFAILTIAFLIEFVKGKNNVQIMSNKLGVIVSLIFVLLGMWYPEFVKANIVALFMASPLGVIPCPTLLATLGLMTLVLPSVGKTPYFITLAIGLIYGIIGAFALKIFFDVCLLFVVIYSVYKYINEINAKTPTPVTNVK